MVEQLEALKKGLSSSPALKAAHSLLDLHSQMLEFDRRLQSYTLAKCTFERNMETCVLE
jgi:hypothetical protein